MTCKGYDLLSQDCINRCKSTETNCDNDIKEFCMNIVKRDNVNYWLSDSDEANKIKELCGAFQDKSFYDKYYTSLKTKTNINSKLPNIQNPECLFEYAGVNATVKPHSRKENDYCSSIEACFTTSGVEKDGNIGKLNNILVSSASVCNNLKVNEPVKPEKVKWVPYTVIGISIVVIIVGVFYLFRKNDKKKD